MACYHRAFHIEHTDSIPLSQNLAALDADADHSNRAGCGSLLPSRCITSVSGLHAARRERDNGERDVRGLGTSDDVEMARTSLTC